MMGHVMKLNYSEGIRRIFTVWCWGWGIGLFVYVIAQTSRIIQQGKWMDFDALAIVVVGTVFWAMIVPALLGMILKWIGDGFRSEKKGEVS